MIPRIWELNAKKKIVRKKENRIPLTARKVNMKMLKRKKGFSVLLLNFSTGLVLRMPTVDTCKIYWHKKPEWSEFIF